MCIYTSWYNQLFLRDLENTFGEIVFINYMERLPIKDKMIDANYSQSLIRYIEK